MAKLAYHLALGIPGLLSFSIVLFILINISYGAALILVKALNAYIYFCEFLWGLVS